MSCVITKKLTLEDTDNEFFVKLKNAKGGYIFLSHSHDDIEKVREIDEMIDQIERAILK